MIPSSTLVPQNHHSQPIPASTTQAKIESKTNWTNTSQFDMSWPAKLTSYVPAHPQPKSETRFEQGIIFTSEDQLNGGEWPVWANGPFAIDVSHQYFEDNKKLQVLWATQTSSYNGGKGSVNSLTTSGGKISHRTCLGVLRCTDDHCPIVLRPVTGGQAKIKTQLARNCQCGAQLEHITCHSRSWTIQWGQDSNNIATRQYRYINGTEHTHSRFPNPARTTSAEDKRFQAAYHARPKATTTQLMVGAPSVDGFTPGAPEHGTKFANPAYTGYRLRREKAKNGHGPTGGFQHFARLKEWKQKHPTVLCEDYTDSNMTCISVQTEWMRQQSLGDLSFNGPQNGLLSDAAHKYWESPDGKLIVTSIFNVLMLKWVPVLFTYSDGTTADHYEYHFLILIKSIVKEAKERNVDVTDELFAMVGQN